MTKSPERLSLLRYRQSCECDRATQGLEAGEKFVERVHLQKHVKISSLGAGCWTINRLASSTNHRADSLPRYCL